MFRRLRVDGVRVQVLKVEPFVDQLEIEEFAHDAIFIMTLSKIRNKASFDQDWFAEDFAPIEDEETL